MEAEQQLLQKDQKRPLTGCGVCRRIINWILQLGVIASMIFFFIKIRKLEALEIVLFVLFYTFYQINSYTSPTCCYLIRKHKNDTIFQYMQRLFYTPAVKTFRVECYHWETRIHTTTDKDGNTRTHTTTHKVTTLVAYEDFSYYSWRDVSGVFTLDAFKVLNNVNRKKTYIKLKLSMSMEFADELTRVDYERQKGAFYDRHKYIDTHCDLTESTSLSGLEAYNLVRISDYKPFAVNWCAYILFTLIIPLIEFYKIYVNSFCVDQDFKLRKKVSTRYNLNDPAFTSINMHSFPRIVIGEEETTYYEPTKLMRDMPTAADLDIEEVQLPTTQKTEKPKIVKEEPRYSGDSISVGVPYVFSGYLIFELTVVMETNYHAEVAAMIKREEIEKSHLGY